MTFKTYQKIQRLGKEENDGILSGLCYIQEKIDGANTSIWFEDGQIKCGSRTRELSEGFNGFYEYVQKNQAIKIFFEKYPDARLYGEWLVRHTIHYKETSYKRWFCFDIEENDIYLPLEEVYKRADECGLETTTLFDKLDNPTPEQLKTYLGKSMLGDVGEGVVIKNFGFINKFARLEYAKMVTENFKENNALVFGGNNKHSETYWEMYVVNKYMTLARIEKIMHKIQPEIDERLDMKHTPRIANTAYHDLLTEEIWEIAGKVQALDFKKLKSVCTKKAIQIYHDILNNTFSVADTTI